MNTALETYIATLLYDYDCVVVPQLGGFVTNYRPARIDEKAGMAYPPGKDIRFNRNLTKNDGLLASAIAAAKDISFEDAGKVISEEVEKAISALQEGTQIKFKKIGVLYFDDHKNMRFEAFNDNNFYRGAFGMEPFSIPHFVKKELPTTEKVDVHLPQPKAETREETPVIPIEAAPEYRRSYTVYKVAAATLIPFIAMSIYMGVSTNFKSPTELTVADFNPFSREMSPALKSLQTYKTRPSATEADADLKLDPTSFPEMAVFPFSFNENRVDSTGVWINMNAVVMSAPLAEKSGLQGNVYHLIGGCFGSEKNAIQFAGQMQALGYNSEILDFHKGLHRVRVAGFDNYEEAIEKLNSIRRTKELSSAWLLKKSL